MNHSNELSNVEKIKQLVDHLNLQRNAYYNENSPNISDAEYDRIFDELVELEKQTGFVLSNSPTQTVGYTPISELPKVKHPVPLLSLDKTKQVQDLISFAGKQPVLFMLKLDGLTTKLVYENGTLVEASTRGDGEIGELITHNIPAYVDVPLSIPYKTLYTFRWKKSNEHRGTLRNYLGKIPDFGLSPDISGYLPSK